MQTDTFPIQPGGSSGRPGPGLPGDPHQLLGRYRSLRCVCEGLGPFDVLRLLLREGEEPQRIFHALGLLGGGSWERLELLVGLWLKGPGLKDLDQHSLALGIHPLSLPLFLPGLASALPRISKATSRGLAACRMNELVLALADQLGVREALRDFRDGDAPGFQATQVHRAGVNSSRILLPGLKFRHSISIWGDSALVALPPGIELGGSLRLRDCSSLRDVPPDLCTGQNLELQRVSALQRMPERVITKGHLEITGPGALLALPQTIHCGGNLKLEVNLGCPGGLEELRVAGHASIRSERLRFLPRGTRIGGHLKLMDCPDLEALPDDLQVHGNLIIRGCSSLRRWGSGSMIRGQVRLEASCPLWSQLQSEPGMAERLRVAP